MVALATRPKPPSNDFSSAAEVIPQLAACFALVRPVSMTDDAAAEWLAVAAGELAGYERSTLRIGMAEARKRCSHHGQIIPTIIKAMEEATPWRMGKPLPRLATPPKQEAIPSPVRGLIEGATRALAAR